MTSRLADLQKYTGYEVTPMESNGKLISSYFGENTFSIEKMKETLSKDVFQKVLNVIEKGEKLDLETANAVAAAMEKWAIEKGCTHYAHWFQPMTGQTAEKHDTFLDFAGTGKYIEQFSGKQLIQGEPDASSFPSGGTRATFEARGYTVWDPTSPAFIMEYPAGNTLTIPTVFVSYTGEVLDKKGPLLRSIEALNKSALGILKLLNNPATKVWSTLGAEQEYFLIDRSFYEARPDLIQTGRTLFGSIPSKHQQMEDQYFGNIPERAFAFMTDIEQESYKLGIPLKTRHNEVAPNQFEVAPIFEEANMAVDHNQILMDLMDRVAKRHGLACLFHEKPFAGVNGSGKHNNWSMATDKGENLLNPGKTPEKNLQFLVFLVATMKAVYKHSRELRAAIASSGNDHRLGANEAPPAIISIFMGEQLSRILKDLEEGKTSQTTDQKWLSMGIDKIPDIAKDNTDRNRTSPFAFTGNKFEFRAVGSSASNAGGITVLNTAVAEALEDLKNEIETAAKGKDLNATIVEVLRKTVKETKNILFDGNGYSEEWVKEAEKRGLPNLKNSPEALEAIAGSSSKSLFTKYNVFSEVELEARYHINLEKYIKEIDIEAKVTAEMTKTLIVPAAISYLNTVLESAQGLKAVVGESDAGFKAVQAIAKQISGYIADIQKDLVTLESTLEKAHGQSSLPAQAKAMVGVKDQYTKIRSYVDALETMVADEQWPLPKYREMLLLL